MELNSSLQLIKEIITCTKQKLLPKDTAGKPEWQKQLPGSTPDPHWVCIFPELQGMQQHLPQPQSKALLFIPEM